VVVGIDADDDRGESHGLSPAATPVYRRVTEMALRHLAAVKELEQTTPPATRRSRSSASSTPPARFGDEPVRDALVKLTQATVQDKLARATDAKKITESVIAGVVSGFTYPPAIQSAHYLALQGAFAAKLHGDLQTKTGWGVAGLYAADAIFAS